MNQQALWHETPEEALRALVDGLGGPKKVGSLLFPDKPMSEAQRLVLKWCDADRHEKPSLTQLLWLMKKGRQEGVHVFMGFIAEESGYSATPVDPADEYAELQKQFVRSVEMQKQLVEQLNRIQQKQAVTTVTPVSLRPAMDARK